MPFVFLSSEYIRARYRPDMARRCLVMRRQALGSFENMGRGRLFFSGLREATESALPWAVHFLSDEKWGYPSHAHVAAYSAIIFAPGMPWGKMTFSDVITMEVPLLFPSRRFLTAAIGYNGPACHDPGRFAGKVVGFTSHVILFAFNLKDK